MQKSPKPTDSKIVVFGKTGVGKSALIVRLLTKRFIWEYDPTLEWTYRHALIIDDENVILEILDTGGQSETPHKEGQVKWGESFLLVYSIDDRDSFEQIPSIKMYIDDIKGTKSSPCIIIGNKADLDHIREVKQEEGEALAEELCCSFFECSASDGDENVAESFHELHRELKRRKVIESRGRRRSSAAAQQVIHVLNKVFHGHKDKDKVHA